ncbi:cytochrome P450 [Mycobacterium sp. shizuoka-1]|uniref:cytochrome P450 n=1 Tax=Mycobacterium sp. shizuoka-1 TaxID=2039281 RepID=UPI000C05CF82|nr:cytochrome P450 [Mycobacterium sp. shizuoka-1]GAY16838.1 putative cytochrome P450 [Mycobacterium sp. shizuoka-1]
MTTRDSALPRLPWPAADPHSYFEGRRSEGDVVWDDTAQAWLVLGYHAARAVLTGAHWSSAPRAHPSVPALDSSLPDANMMFTDGPAHVRLRGAVSRMFTRGAVVDLRAGIELICADAVSAIPAGRPFDLMTQVALPLPIAVVGAWLGLDADQCAALRLHSPAIIRILGGVAERGELEDGMAAAAALVADFLPAAADRRAHPQADLLSYLATDPALSLDEVVITALLIAVAGHETTANLLGAGLVRLLDTADDGTRIVDRVDPGDPEVLTELERLDAPVQAVSRTATAPHTLAGVDIRCGETVLVCLAAANRDPGVYRRAAEFHLERAEPPPLTFGHGAHYCLGAALARLETSTALQRVLRRQPTLVGPVIWRDVPAIRGPVTVPVQFAR